VERFGRLQRLALSGDSAEGAQLGALRAAAVPVTATASFDDLLASAICFAMLV
jgi:hypothetical protein